MIQVPEAFRWQGVERIYTLPWIANRVGVTADPARISAYAGSAFTRSTMLMNLLRQFHLSNNSILVSSDEHSGFLRTLLLRSFPAPSEYPAIAQELVGRIFGRSHSSGGSQTLRLAPVCVREMYVTLLQSILGVQILPPLQVLIDGTDFSPGWRPLRLEGLMYALGLHSPMLAPLRIGLDLAFFREARRMRKISRRFEQDVYDFTQAAPGSWFETLQGLVVANQISRAHFRGEITSVLVSSFSLASALSFSLLCLSARPRFIEKIRTDPKFAKYFLMEVLRLYPPFHQFGYQRPDRASQQPNEPETDFLISAYHLHRNPEVWAHADQFWPERFQGADHRTTFRYLPFGLGTRSCPGRLYSLQLLTEVLKYVCSDASPMRLLPSDSLPTGQSDRLISFPLDDRFECTQARP